MTIARKHQVSLEHTRYYHCTSRCVRRAFLCGKDYFTGRDFNHRRQWIEDRLAFLQSVFAIELLAYAVMSDHYHIVLRVNAKKAQHWDTSEVTSRWKKLFRVADEASITDKEITLWRQRLFDISWFMRCINERIARSANREDRCTGRFWEGRFKLQALLDETAVLTCMVYVDLNPIRADLTKLPECSTHTSIKARIENRAGHLMPLLQNCGNHREAPNPGEISRVPLQISQEDYLYLVDWSGRIVRNDKRGFIPAGAPPILSRLNRCGESWSREIRYYGTWYFRAAGSLDSLQDYCNHLKQKWLKGMGRADLKPHIAL